MQTKVIRRDDSFLGTRCCPGCLLTDKQIRYCDDDNEDNDGKAKGDAAHNHIPDGVGKLGLTAATNCAFQNITVVRNKKVLSLIVVAKVLRETMGELHAPP